MPLKYYNYECKPVCLNDREHAMVPAEQSFLKYLLVQKQTIKFSSGSFNVQFHIKYAALKSCAVLMKKAAIFKFGILWPMGVSK